MKRKLLVVFILLMFVCGCTKKEEVKTIPEYEADIKCVSHIEEENDGELDNYTSNVYITLDENNNVTKSIYQSISESTVFDKATLELTNQFLAIYDGIDGIEANAETYDNSLVITIKYDYNKMNLTDVKKKLGTIVEDDNILKKAKSLPFSYDEFKKYNLNGYECK